MEFELNVSILLVHFGAPEWSLNELAKGKGVLVRTVHSNEELDEVAMGMNFGRLRFDLIGVYCESRVNPRLMRLLRHWCYRVVPVNENAPVGDKFDAILHASYPPAVRPEHLLEVALRLREEFEEAA